MAKQTTGRFLPEDSPTRHRLEALREAVTPLLATELLLHFTDHSVDHSDRVAGFVDDLIEPLMGTRDRLSETELALIYAACYVHDLGMHVEALSELTTVSSRLGGRPWRDLTKGDRETFIRTHHHRISAELICRAARHESPCQSLPVSDLFPDEVASLCEAHQLDLDVPDQRAEYSKHTQFRAGNRMGLLAATLRIADILDDSQWRACRDKAQILSLDERAKKHWWRHYYTEHVSIDRGTVRLQFKFPTDRKVEYEQVVPRLQVPLIQAEIRRHEGVLTAHGVMRNVESVVLDPPHSTKEAMPDSVYLAMAAELQRREEAAADRQRLSVLDHLRHTRPAVKRQLADLGRQRQQLSPEEYARQTWDLTESLRGVGGVRSSWMEFTRVYNSIKSKLAPRARIEYGLRLATCQVADESAFLAMNTLDELLPLVKDLPGGDPLRFAFRRQHFAALYDLAIHYKDAVEAGRDAVALAPSEQEQREMVADLAEMAFLIGEPDDALRELQGVCDGNQTVRGPHDLAIILLRWRLEAMAGGIATVMASISQVTAASSIPARDKTKILSFKAELLCADGRLAGAVNVFRNELWPSLGDLSTEEAQTVADCYQSVALGVQEKEPLVDFYEVVDDRHLLAIPWEDERNALLGLDAAEDDRHYDAMACLVRAARAAYRRGSWCAFRWACARLARECVRTGSLPDATFYVLQAQDDKVSKVVTDALRRSSKPEDMAKSTAHLLRFAHLAVHARTACDFFGELADEIPDGLVPTVVEYLLGRTRVVSESSFSSWDVSRSAWRALAGLTPRFDAAFAERAVEAVLATPGWADVGIKRLEMVRVLDRAVAKLPCSKLLDLVKECSPLVTTGKFDYDLRETMGLLCNIADRGGEQVRGLLAKDLFPTGSFGGNGLLLKVASLLGVEPQPAELLSFADAVLKRLRNQIVVLMPDAETPKGDLSNFARVVDGRKIVTYDTPVTPLWGIVRHLGKLPIETRVILIKAMLSNLANPEDSVANKVRTLDLLPLFHAHLPDVSKRVLQESVLDLAESGIVLPSGMPGPEEAQHPLQRFRLSMGGPADVMGSAIRCLALIEEAEPGTFGPRLAAVLERGLTHGDADVRRSAFLALQHRVPRTKAVMDRVILGTRDDDPDTAAAALYAVARAETAEITPSIDSVLYSLECAVRSTEKRLRGAAAAVVGRLAKTGGVESTGVLTQLEQKLASDRCFSVREAVREGQDSVLTEK